MTKANFRNRTLFHGDNLDFLRALSPVHSVRFLKLGKDISGRLTCLGIVDTPRSSIFYRYRRCVYEWSRNFTSEKAV